jgi:mannose-6-phosphate isomerase
VKLLDTGERLFVHLHPDDATARRELGSPIGKTECWLVIGVRDAGPGSGEAWVGFRDEVDAATLAGWVERQDAEAMLAAMNRVHVAVGETLLVPAGVPHAVGPGITVVELQQPSDLSLLLEWEGYPGLDPANAFLGLGRETVIAATDRSGWADRVAGLRGALAPGAPALPDAAAPFFRADAIAAGSGWPASFAIVVGLEGEGALRSGAGELALRRGDTAVVPFAAGDVLVAGGLTVALCRPPLP